MEVKRVTFLNSPDRELKSPCRDQCHVSGTQTVKEVFSTSCLHGHTYFRERREGKEKHALHQAGHLV